MRVKGLCVKCQSETAEYEYILLNVTCKYKTLRKYWNDSFIRRRNGVSFTKKCNFF